MEVASCGEKYFENEWQAIDWVDNKWQKVKLDRVVVSTDDEKIAEVSKSEGANTLY